jgi:glutamate formiminotransferase/formiminotetrahydrofolate cyclodeaminase
MVGNLTYEKKGFEKSKPILNELAENGQKLKTDFLRDVDNDMNAYNSIVESRRLPKGSAEEAKARDEAIHKATVDATLVPLGVLKRCDDALNLVETAIEKGNPNSLSDAGVAGLMALAAAEGAYYNVLINLAGFDKQHADFVRKTAKEADGLIEAVRKKSGKAATKVQDQLMKEFQQAVAK